MKVNYKGFIKNRKSLPHTPMPENAVPFTAPETKFDVRLPSFVFIFLSAILIWLIYSLAQAVRGDQIEINLMNVGSIIGLVLGVLCVPIQGLIRGRFYGEDAEVDVYISIGFIYTICTMPVPRNTFIKMGIIPSLFIGWLPLLLAAFIPMPLFLLDLLFVWGFISVVFSSSYYTSAYCAVRQMPEGSYAIMYGADYYWFLP